MSAGIAILRYRLYDIDRIINRTLVYGLVTALLGLVYAVLVLLLGQVFGEVSGDPPNWAVAGATLAVARCSSRPGVASRRSSIAASIAAGTTRSTSTR